MVQRGKRLETDANNHAKHFNVHRNGTKSFFGQRESHVRTQELKEQVDTQGSNERGSTSATGDANCVEVLDSRFGYTRGLVDELEPAAHQSRVSTSQESTDLSKRLDNVEKRMETVQEQHRRIEADHEVIKARFHGYEVKLARLMVAFPVGSQSTQPGSSST